MSDIIEIDELLFFDTFSHEEINDINLDLVQFPKPVFITQVRIIPLGARVQADFPGGVRLGATNPSKFDIEFFVNDLGMPGASTFEILGHLRYNQNDCIHLDCSQGKIPTDGLVLRGWYSTITLAVYGVLTNAVHETIASPIPPSEPTVSEEIIIGDAGIVAAIQNEELKDDWQEPIPEEIMPHKASTSDDYDPEDMEYTLSREHYHHHSEGEREQREMRRLHRFSRSTEHSPTSRTRTHSESNEREYIRLREKIPRDWSRSPEYSRRPRRKRSRSDAEESHKWPRTPPASIDSPSRQDPMDYDDEDSHYKLQKSHAYRQPTESPAHVINDDEEETSGTPNEQFEPILSDDEIIGDDEEDEVDEAVDAAAAAELENEINAEALNAPPAINIFNPWLMPLLKYKGDFHVHFGKDIENLHILFKKFVLQTKCDNFEAWQSLDKIGVEEREQFVHFGEQLNSQISYLSLRYKRRNFVIQEFFDSDEQHRLQVANILQISLNFEIACLQNLPALKIRHIKVGAKLAEILCSNADFFVYLTQEKSFDVFEALFNLYNIQYMALSIKLQILKSMYSLLDIKVAVHHFLNSKDNGYKMIVEALKTAKLTRTKYALQAIMRKLHLYEALESINDHCSQLFVLTNYYPDGNKPLATFQQIEYAFEMVLDALIHNSLSYQQPRRLLPVSKTFEINWDLSAQRNLGNALQAYFAQHSLAESILMLLINGHEMPVSTLMCTLNVIHSLLQTYIGLNYFVDDAFETTQLIVAVLLDLQDVPEQPDEEMEVEKTDDLEMEKTPEENEPNETEVTPEKQIEKEIKEEDKDGNNVQITMQECSPEEIKMIEEFNKPYMIYSMERLRTLGLELSYKVQTRYHLDSIMYTATSDNYDIIKLADHLHALYSQTCDHLGRQFTCEVIGINNHMQIFMDVIMKEQRLQTQHQISNPGTKYKSPVLSYAVDIVDCCVRYCEHLDYLIEHGTTILELAKNHDSFEPSVSAVLQEMFVYLKPLETVKVSSYEDISPLVEVIARSMDYITTFPGDLIMGLRILRHLAISKGHDRIDGKSPKNSRVVELKHRYIALQFYTAEGVPILLQLLERLCNYFEQPGLHAPSLTTIQGVHCCQILLPTLQVLREILSFAIKCRDVDFKDIGAIDPLMRVYFLLYYYPRRSQAMADVELARQEIVQTLLAYTQPNEQHDMSVHKSLWTQMVRELLKNIDNPSSFIPGLQLLAELLPLPLPMPLPISDELQKQQKQRLITERKLWAAHLQPQSFQIAKLIDSLAHSSFPQLSELLQRVCMQLSDLAPNMSLLVAKTIIELLWNEWQSTNFVPTTQLARLLVFSARLWAFAPLKTSTLTVLCGKLWDLFQALLSQTLLTVVVYKCQIAIHRILESFLDSGISLISRKSTADPFLNLASTLPPKELIPAIVESILGNLFIVDITNVVSAQALRNLVILTEHDYPIYHLTQTLKQKCIEFQDWIEKLLTHNNPLEYLTTIELLILLLRSLTQIEPPPEHSVMPHRTLKLTACELVQIINYQATSENANKPHVLQRILNILEEHNVQANEDALRDLRQLIELVTTCETPTSTATTSTATSDTATTSTATTGTATTSTATTSTSITGITTTGIATIGTATTGVATIGIATTGVAPIGIATTGVAPIDTATTSVAAIGTATTGIAPICTATTGVAPIDTATTSVAAIGTATTGVAPIGIATTGVATIGTTTTCVATIGTATTGIAAIGTATSVGTTTVEVNGEDEASVGSASNCGSSEPYLSQAEGLVTLYDARPIFTRFPSNANDDKLTSRYWLEPLPIEIIADLDDLLYERIPCDLTELATACLMPDMNLTGDCKRALHLSASPQSNRERTPTAPCFRTRRVEVEPTTGRPEKKMFITAVRGRGYSRPPPSRGDLFRSRPPNTSRPPSLHVDDFLALETCGAQPTGPTGYNKIPSMLRGARIGRNRGSRIAAATAFRQKKLMRTSSPSMWSEASSSGIYRPSPSEVHYNIVDVPHYSGGMPHFSNRSRSRGPRSRPPYMR